VLAGTERAMVAAKLENLPRGGDRRRDQGANLRLAPVTAPSSEAVRYGWSAGLPVGPAQLIRMWNEA
jgi:hypothetical protein